MLFQRESTNAACMLVVAAAMWVGSAHTMAVEFYSYNRETGNLVRVDIDTGAVSVASHHDSAGLAPSLGPLTPSMITDTSC